MINVKKLRKLKGRRIYLFWLDEKTGDITDVTSRDDVIQVIRCKDCMAFDEKKVLCKKNNMIAVREDDWCSRAERKEE